MDFHTPLAALADQLEQRFGADETLANDDELRINQLEAVTAGLVQRVAELELRPVPAPAPAPTRVNAPVANIAGYTQVIAENFTQPCALGQFETVYKPPSAAARFGYQVYPTSYMDTATQKMGRTPQAHYNPGIISVADGILSMDIGSNADGSINVCTILPHLTQPAATAKYSYATAAIVQLRFRADPLPGFKFAWMLWRAVDALLANGEIDFMEGPLDGHNLGCFVHLQGATSNSDQAAFKSAVNPVDGNWHDARLEWVAADHVYVDLDGVRFASQTARVPAFPMRLALQTETGFSNGVPTPIDAKTRGRVQIMHLSAWSKP